MNFSGAFLIDVRSVGLRSHTLLSEQINPVSHSHTSPSHGIPPTLRPPDMVMAFATYVSRGQNFGVAVGPGGMADDGRGRGFSCDNRCNRTTSRQQNGGYIYLITIPIYYYT